MKSVAKAATSLFVRESGLSGRVAYRLMETPEEKDCIYLMRYKAYLHGGLILPSESQRVTDVYDDAPNALTFWARRQANETAVHRCDAESARGPVRPLTTADAVDALDEWLALAVRQAHAPDGEGRILRLVPADAGGVTWSVILGERVEVTSDRGQGHCEIRGSASDLYLWSMNRRGTEDMAVSGDPSLLQVWADNIRF